MAIFIVNTSIIGDCNNDGSGIGSVSAVPNRNTNQPFTYHWYEPELGFGNTKAGLSAGVYHIIVSDSSVPPNTVDVALTISSGVCASITSLNNTSCGNENGEITVTANSVTPFSNTFSLYNENDTLLSSVFVTSNTHTFGALSEGLYYSVVEDGGGCVGKTQLCLVKDSNDLNFGAFIVPESSCQAGTGRITITGLSFTENYFFTWTDGNGTLLDSTTNTLSGLTSGTYVVTILSPNNCEKTAIYEVGTAPNILASFIDVVPPNCFSSNGKATLSVNGGTPPFFFNGLNGQSQITFDDSFVFTGLSQGVFTATVTDVTLCQVTSNVYLSAPNSFGRVGVTKINPGCNEDSGEIIITVGNGSPPFTFGISGPTEQSVFSLNNSHTFHDLGAGSYVVTVSSQNSTCVFTENVELTFTPSFDFTYTVTDSTCGQNNGTISVSVDDGGIAPFIYTLSGVENITQSSSMAEIEFQDLSPGTYSINVRDANGCVRNHEVLVEAAPLTNLILSSTDCSSGADGTITAMVISGVPPFTFEWSPNVSTGFFASDLPGGVYSLTVTDSNGCSDTESVEIKCHTIYSDLFSFEVCKDPGMLEPSGRIGLIEILNDGFQNLTSGNTDCTLNSATLTVNVTANGATLNEVLYVSSSLTDVPSDSTLSDKISEMLLSITGIGGVQIDYEGNLIQVFSDCSIDNDLTSIFIDVGITINYDIDCKEY